MFKLGDLVKSKDDYRFGVVEEVRGEYCRIRYILDDDGVLCHYFWNMIWSMDEDNEFWIKIGE